MPAADIFRGNSMTRERYWIRLWRHLQIPSPDKYVRRKMWQPRTPSSASEYLAILIM
jgi:hypothetical protein